MGLTEVPSLMFHQFEETHPKSGFPLASSWLLGDHLGSTSMVVNASGVMVNETRYSTFGETRYQYIAPNETLRTDYLYTGQRQEAEIGLYYYVARWYDPAIGRFTQADIVVPDPGVALGYDRYAYSWNNPVKFIDPSGYTPCLDGICEVGVGQNGNSVSFTNIFGRSASNYHIGNIQLLNFGGAHLSSMGFDMTGDFSGDGNNHQARSILQKFVGILAEKTSTNSNEIQASTVELAVVIGADIEDLIAVLSGHIGEGWKMDLSGWDKSNNFRDNLSILASTTPLGPYETFDELSFGADRMGMNEKYADPLLDSPVNNQVHHIWFYLQVGYYKGAPIAALGNLWHEKWSNDGGQSQQDIDAGVWGYTAGQALRLKKWNLSDLAAHIRSDLGE